MPSLNELNWQVIFLYAFFYPSAGFVSVSPACVICCRAQQRSLSVGKYISYLARLTFAIGLVSIYDVFTVHFEQFKQPAQKTKAIRHKSGKIRRGGAREGRERAGFDQIYQPFCPQDINGAAEIEGKEHERRFARDLVFPAAQILVVAPHPLYHAEGALSSCLRLYSSRWFFALASARLICGSQGFRSISRRVLDLVHFSFAGQFRQAWRLAYTR